MTRWHGIRLQGDVERLKEIVDKAVSQDLLTGTDEKEAPVRHIALEGSRMTIAFGKSSMWERCQSICILKGVAREEKVKTFSIEWPDADEWLKEQGIEEKYGRAVRYDSGDFRGL